MVGKTKLKPSIIPQTNKKDQDNAITSKIIKQKVNSDLYTNIVRKRNSH